MSGTSSGAIRIIVVENLTGLDKLEYSLSAGREGGITDPDYLHKVDAFAEWYRQQPEVTHVEAFSDIMKRLNKNIAQATIQPSIGLPADPDLAAQYLLLYELSLPFGSDLNDRIDVAKSATRLVRDDQKWRGRAIYANSTSAPKSGSAPMHPLSPKKHRASASSLPICRCATSTACCGAQSRPWRSFRSS